MARIAPIFFTVLLTAIFLVSPASAVTWTINPDGTGDAPTLHAAVDSAASGDTLSLGDGIFHAYGNRNVDSGGKALFVRSASGNAESCIIDCAGVGRAFIVPHVEGESGGLQGLTVINGLGATGGGAVLLTEAVTRRAATSPMEFVIRDCRFFDNVGNGDGGALQGASDFDLTIENSRFARNENNLGWFTWAAGGAISIKSTGLFGVVHMKHCMIDSNNSVGPGGGLYISNSSVHLDSCDVSYNVSGLDSALGWPAGAGLHVVREGIASPDMVVNLANSTFESNIGTADGIDCSGDGGGVLIRGYDADRKIDVHVTDCDFRRNFSVQGGGLYVGRFSTALVERCRFIENTAFYNAGGSYKGGQLIANLGEWARYEFCEFRGNRAGYDRDGLPTPVEAKGGAFATRLWPRGEFVNCSFFNNRAGGASSSGDAIMHYNQGGTFRFESQRCLLINCVFYGTGGNDVQVRSDEDGFSAVTHSAWEAGEFQAAGISPTDVVILDESPFAASDGVCLSPTTPCIDAGLFIDSTFDLHGTPVPQNLGTDIGACEWVYFTGIDERNSGSDPPTRRDREFFASPNPLNPRTTIRFELEISGPVRLTIHDITGRRLAMLVDAEMRRGAHQVDWNGLDSAGREAASGVYYARLHRAGITSSQKLLLLR